MADLAFPILNTFILGSFLVAGIYNLKATKRKD